MVATAFNISRYTTESEATAFNLPTYSVFLVSLGERLLLHYDAFDAHQPEAMAEPVQAIVSFLEPLRTVHETRSEEVFSKVQS